MPQSKEHEGVRGQADPKQEFFRHAVVYVAVMVLLMVIDVLTSPGTIWFIWPLAGWGLGLALHGARVFLRAGKHDRRRSA
jgi:hypothetical protein